MCNMTPAYGNQGEGLCWCTRVCGGASDIACCHSSRDVGGCLLLFVSSGHSWPIVVVVGSHYHWWRVVDCSCCPSLWGLDIMGIKNHHQHGMPRWIVGVPCWPFGGGVIGWIIQLAMMGST